MKRALVAGLLVWAASGAATPTGKKWKQLPQSYKVFNHSQVNGISAFSTQVLPKVQNAFARWVTAQVACTQWNVQYAGTFSTPTGRNALVATDGQNLVLWLGGSDWQESAATLAATYVTSVTATGEIVGADMAFNNNLVWSVSGSASAYDVESIATHEAGHFLGLGHTTSVGTAVMYPTFNPGEVRRTLVAADRTDVCTVYPADAGSGAPQGSACTQTSQCATGLVCRSAQGATSAICTVDCTSNPACPSGYSCQDASSGKACLPVVGAPDLCRFCANGQECSSGICATDGRHTWCSSACTTAADCGASGYDCVGEGAQKVCAPTGGCSGQCTAGSSSCPLGFACVGGRCEATGNAGDRCEVLGYCKSCSLCVGDLSLAQCRPCCDGQGAGGLCDACAPATCGAAAICDAAQGTPDKVCVPGQGAALCEACSNALPCREGLECAAGRCHAPCNPNSPASCSACFATGSATGLCACSGESAAVGEPCGATSTGFAACLTGALCVDSGAGGVCRSPCTLGDDASCGSGQQCSQVQGRAVCVPGTTPGTQCNACVGGQCDPGLVCHQERCYQPCNAQAPECSACVPVASGESLCACENQKVGAGQACGAQSLTPATCRTGLECVERVCRAPCDESRPNTCPVGTTCQGSYCLPGSLGPGGGGGSVDGGVGPAIQSAGCGCTHADAFSGVALALVLWGTLRRRRSSR